MVEHFKEDSSKTAKIIVKNFISFYHYVKVIIICDMMLTKKVEIIGPVQNVI
jgi:hypothetical protein